MRVLDEFVVATRDAQLARHAQMPDHHVTVVELDDEELAMTSHAVDAASAQHGDELVVGLARARRDHASRRPT